MSSIAIVLPDLRGGGVERVRLHLGKEFLARGHAVNFVLMKARGELLPMVPQGAGVVEMKAARLRSVLLPLARYLREARPDAVLAAMWPLTSIAIWARELARVRTRLVVSDHTDYSAAPAASSLAGRLKLRTSMRWSYPRADGVVAVSGGAAGSIADFAGVPRERITVIHNPVCMPSMGEAERPCAGAAAWVRHEGPRLIAVGSLKPAKNFALLLAAFANVRQHTDARLLVLGEGPLRGELEALRCRLELDGAVDMPGFVPDPYPYLARANVFVLSSAWEGFGNVIVEALACGTKVVSTDCPSGPREILEDGRYGRLVPVGDTEALAQAILSALDDGHDRAALIRRSQDFSIEMAADQYLRLLLPEHVR